MGSVATDIVPTLKISVFKYATSKANANVTYNRSPEVKPLHGQERDEQKKRERSSADKWRRQPRRGGQVRVAKYTLGLKHQA